ncbi:hypothetical protein ASN88_00458 [Streptococcus parauberis]|uniref:hypothetical protein n=1 Tax=Streptococcus parauberis TaxID=1348 RepID=UPI000CCF780F|nr:hypothetical protein [Streptococcus parauberis]PNY22464.1 hypothetical protein ASN88_00458 [Streptococcus parauberis]
MKKKLLGILVLAFSAIFLVACSNASTVKKDNLDGTYYELTNDYDNELAKGKSIEIEGDSLKEYHTGATYVYSIDKEKHTLSGNGSMTLSQVFRVTNVEF